MATPTPKDAALIRELAKTVADLKKITDLRNATVGAQAIEAAYTAEVAAQARLAAEAARLGIPLAEATTEYGLASSTALVPAGAAPTGGLVLRGVTAVGQVVGGGAATGTAIVLVGAGLLAWLLSSMAGKMAADKPIQAVSRTHKGGPNVATFDTKPQVQGDKYYIYAVNTSGWSFYIGRSTDVEGRAAKSFQDGGTGSQPIEYKKLVSKEFVSSSEATEYLKARVSPGHHSVWTGTWLKFEGAEYRTVHVGL